MNLPIHEAMSQAGSLAQEDGHRIQAAWRELLGSGPDRKMQFLEEEFLHPLGEEMTRFNREMNELRNTLSSIPHDDPY